MPPDEASLVQLGGGVKNVDRVWSGPLNGEAVLVENSGKGSAVLNVQTCFVGCDGFGLALPAKKVRVIRKDETAFSFLF